MVSWVPTTATTTLTHRAENEHQVAGVFWFKSSASYSCCQRGTLSRRDDFTKTDASRCDRAKSGQYEGRNHRNTTSPLLVVDVAGEKDPNPANKEYKVGNVCTWRVRLCARVCVFMQRYMCTHTHTHKHTDTQTHTHTLYHVATKGQVTAIN